MNVDKMLSTARKPSFSLADDISGHGDSVLGDSVHGSTSISTSSPNSSSSSSFSRYSGTVSADINTEHERHSFVCRHSKTSKKKPLTRSFCVNFFIRTMTVIRALEPHYLTRVCFELGCMLSSSRIQLVYRLCCLLMVHCSV